MKITKAQACKKEVEDKIQEMLNNLELDTGCRVKSVSFAHYPGMVVGKRVRDTLVTMSL